MATRISARDRDRSPYLARRRGLGHRGRLHSVGVRRSQPAAPWLDLGLQDGTGSGSVVSNPNGIDCGDTCAWSFLSDDDPGYDPVSLTASVDPGSKFTGWGGSCFGSGGCVIDPVKRLESYGVTATFTADRPNDFPPRSA